MDFEIIGLNRKLNQLRRELVSENGHDFKSDTAAVDGEREKELPKFDWKPERSS